MSAYFLGLLMFLAYGVFCLLAPEKHLALYAWLDRRGRKEWHKTRAYTTPYMRMYRRWSQRTPANLRRIRWTGIACIGMVLYAMWEYWRIRF